MSERTVYDHLCTTGKQINVSATRSRRELQQLAYKFQDDEDNPRLEVMLNRARGQFRESRIELGRHVAHCTDGCRRATGERQVPLSKAWDRSPTHHLPEMPPLAEVAAMLRAGARLEDLAPAWGRRADGIASRLNVGGWNGATGEPLAKAPKSRTPLPVRVPDWEQAVCAETDAELFFPDTGGSVESAKRMCARCPIREACLEYAFAVGDDTGVWGGMSAAERRARRRTAPRKCADCEAVIPRGKGAPIRCVPCREKRRTAQRTETKRRARLQVAS